MQHSTSRVVVTESKCSCHSVSTTQIHHRHFPEIWAQGPTALEGATQLTRHLERALEASRSQWHTKIMREALADVSAFLDALHAHGYDEEQGLPLPSVLPERNEPPPTLTAR
jgi:hypothetical protein